MIIAVDFDGTCVTHSFPNLGDDIGAVPVLKKLVANGHKLILWTMRSNGQKEAKTEIGRKIYAGDFLQQAVDWFKNHDIPLYGIQENPTQKLWTSSPKCYAEMYIDDAAFGAPLVYDTTISERPFINWKVVEEQLIKMKLI